MTPPFRAGQPRRGFSAGLDALEALLVEKGSRPRNLAQRAAGSAARVRGDER